MPPLPADSIHARACKLKCEKILTRPSVYKTYDDLPLFLNANLVAQVLGVSPSSGYELMHEPGFPVLRVGSRMVVPKEQFIRWVTEHTEGGGRG